MRRAKVVATLGPASASAAQVLSMVRAGMDVARLNMSHGKYSEHEQVYANVRRAAMETGRAVGILADLQGPKIRIGTFADGPVQLSRGDTFTLTTEGHPGDQQKVSTTYSGLCGDVSPGDRLLIDDGRVELVATAVTDAEVVTTVLEGGVLSNNKGVNLPGVPVDVPALSAKDERDLRWALNTGVDFIALSFVRDAMDISRVHEIMAEENIYRPVIAKIEKPQAVAHLEEIIIAFDGIMIARGDLGVELPLEDVPLVQKRAVVIARHHAKPVIVATQVLESMIENPRPTRAETSDCANAVLDGADAIMLSGETSIGNWPVEAVQMMCRIIASTEEHGLEKITTITKPPTSMGGVVSAAAAEIAVALNCRYVVTFTTTGDSARRMTRLRPRLPLVAFTPSGLVRSQLALTWGVETILAPRVRHTDEMAQQVDAHFIADARCRKGDRVVIVAGSPPGVPGSTNALRVHKIGDAEKRLRNVKKPDSTGSVQAYEANNRRLSNGTPPGQAPG